MEQTMTLPNDGGRFHFRLSETADPRQRLWSGIRYYMGEQARWITPYDQVAAWLSDNDGRGLICVGTCGLGKSLICEKVLPVLFKYHFKKDVMTVTAIDMNRRIDELLAYCEPGRVIIIDDLGTEPAETVFFGNRRRPFCELVDTAERNGTLLVITTNLRTTARRLKRDYGLFREGDPDPQGPPSIEQRYGMPTLDRLRATTHVAVFTGESMRK